MPLLEASSRLPKPFGRSENPFGISAFWMSRVHSLIPDGNLGSAAIFGFEGREGGSEFSARGGRRGEACTVNPDNFFTYSRRLRFSRYSNFFDFLQSTAEASRFAAAIDGRGWLLEYEAVVTAASLPLLVRSRHKNN